MLSLKPWRPSAVVFFVCAQICCFLSGGLAMAVLHKAGAPGFRSLDGPGNVLIGTLTFQGATWVLMGMFFSQHGIRLRDGLGFTRGNVGRALLLAFATTALFFFAALWLQSLSIYLMEKIHWTPKPEAAVSLLAGTHSVAMQVYLGIFAVVIAPVAEEFIFRGVLFPFIKQLGWTKTAWIGVSLFFALIHGDAAIFMPLFLLALVLAWLYEVTDNLLAPIFAHALFNAANLVLLQYFPQ